MKKPFWFLLLLNLIFVLIISIGVRADPGSLSTSELTSAHSTQSAVDLPRTDVLPAPPEGIDMSPDDLDHFQPVPPNEQPYTIRIQSASLNGQTMQQGDEIGIFDGPLCVGAVSISGEWPLNLISWQANPDQGEQGFIVGHNMEFILWVADLDREFNPDVTYISGNGRFGYGSFTEVILSDQFTNIMVNNIRANYFELVSTYITNTNMDANSAFGEIDNLMIVYRDDGAVYIPPYIDGIDIVEPQEGYQVYCTEQSQWIMEGQLVDPEIIFELNDNQWNYMGYPFPIPLNIDLALSEIAEWVRIVVDDNGNFWIPGLVNTIGEMQPGEAYFVFTSIDLQFHFVSQAVMSTGEWTPETAIPVSIDAPNPTGKPYIILVTLDEKLLNQSPATVEVLDGSRVVGKSLLTIDMPFTPIVAWGCDTDHGIDGFQNGHSISIAVRRADGSLVDAVSKNSTTIFGADAYAEIQLAQPSIPVAFTIGSAFPNPFNSTVNVPVSLPAAGTVTMSIYTTTGRLVASNDYVMEAGTHRISIDFNQIHSSLSSGLYLVQSRYSGQVAARKIMFLK